MTPENPDEIIGRTLWGDPVYRQARTRGRPPFEWTQENSFKVSMLLAMGWTNERIAGTILDPRTGKRISVPTLKRHFRSELVQRDQARDQLEAKQLMVAAGEAFSGNVGAMRLLTQLIEKNDQRVAARKFVPNPDEKPAGKEKPVGKKEAAQRAAEDVGGGGSFWGNDLTPGFGRPI